MLKTEILAKSKSPTEVLVSDAIGVLRNTLITENKSDLRILVDPALADPMDSLRAQHGLPLRRLSGPFGDVSAEVKPYLVSVADVTTHERFVSETISLAVQESLGACDDWPGTRSVCAWLIMSHDEARTFSLDFGLRSLVHPAGDPARRRLLRFWDPRVLPQLARIIGKTAWPGWMNIDAVWLYIDGWGRMISQRFVKPVGFPAAPWRPSAAAWQALERVQEVNHGLVMSGALHEPPDHCRLEQLDRLLARASELGCSRAIDRVTYAVLADSMRLPLEEHPKIAAMLKRTKHGNESFSDLLSVLEPTDWECIRDELMRNAQPAFSSFSVQVTP